MVVYSAIILQRCCTVAEISQLHKEQRIGHGEAPKLSLGGEQSLGREDHIGRGPDPGLARQHEARAVGVDQRLGDGKT